MAIEADLAATLVEVVKESLREGVPVELDGLGVFHLRPGGAVEFVPEEGPRVFIAYIAEDARLAVLLSDALEAAGIRVWIDKRRLLPGQDWPRAIERAIDRSDFFIACFSRRASRKRGQFPYELRYALRCADRMPLDDQFVIPVRFEDCEVSQRICATTQYLDVFPDWNRGVEQLIASILREYSLRRRRDAA